MGSPSIVVDDLRVVRGRRLVLRGLSCVVSSARVTGLLGPSGAGKTTLMRALVGVQEVAGGTVEVLGEPAGSPGLRRRIAYMTQGSSVYPDLSVEENVRYFARLVGAPGPRTAEVLGEVGLSGARRQLVGTLSGGQMSRVSLACALVGDPEVLILDEPTVGQDPVLRAELWAGFHERAEHGCTVLVSSHVMEEAARCEDILLVRDGELLAHETPEALLERTGAADLDAAFLALVSRRDG